jgi:hypothetical protein
MAILICHFNLKTSLFTISLLLTPSTPVSQYWPEQFDQCQSKKALIITFQISLHVALKATAIISNIVRLQSKVVKHISRIKYGITVLGV